MEVCYFWSASFVVKSTQIYQGHEAEEQEETSIEGVLILEPIWITVSKKLHTNICKTIIDIKQKNKIFTTLCNDVFRYNFIQISQ